MEETVRAEFDKIDAGLTDDEKRGRVDLRFQTVPGRHVIVELKRYNRRVAVSELVAQLRKYRDALRKCLKERYPSEPQAIECVAVLGSAPCSVRPWRGVLSGGSWEGGAQWLRVRLQCLASGRSQTSLVGLPYCLAVS